MVARPRVLHLSPTLYGKDGTLAGGGERYAFELARHMSRFQPTRLVSFGPDDLEERIDDLTLRIYGGGWSNRRGAVDPLPLRALAREARAATIVHCHQRNYRVSKAAGALARALGGRSFVTDHGGGIWGPGVWMPDRHCFDGHLFVSEFSRRAHPPPRGVPAGVVFGGVDESRFRPGGARSPDSILFVGRLLPHKGVDVLIEALPPGLRLDVVGKPLDERYLADLRALAHDKPVRFHHDCDDTRIAEAYRAARCVVMPSVYRDRYGGGSEVPELLGQVLLEAMASGTLVICSDAGGMPEIVVPDVTGFVFPAGSPEVLTEHLTVVRDDDERVQRMGDAAREHVVKHFTWDAVACRCLREYDHVTGRPCAS